jgi:hypothetical protein
MAGLIHLELLTDFFNKIDPLQTSDRFAARGLFDDFICTQQESFRDGKPDRLGGLEVNDRLVLHGCLYRQAAIEG